MKRLALVLLAACPGTAPPPPPAAPLEPPAASVACYQGLSTGMGQAARTIARRTLDPAAGQIIEEVANNDGKAPKAFRVVMTVEGNRFTMAEAGGAFHGTGTLTGEPWRWTSWTSSSQLPSSTITVESTDELTPAGMKATKQIKRDGKAVATTSEELTRFDCAGWDKAQADLAAPVPVLDAAACDRACRNFATLKFWPRAEAAIARLPPADQAAARTQQAAVLARELDTGLAPCESSCLSANNAAQTACMASATSVEQLGACE